MDNKIIFTIPKKVLILPLKIYLMKIYPFFLLLGVLSACVSQSSYQQSMQLTNEAMTDKERYIRELANTRRELNKLQDEYKTFQTVSQTVLEDKDNQLKTQQAQIEAANNDCNTKIAEAQKNATKSCDLYKNQAQKWQEQESREKVILTKNQNTSQELRDSVQVLDSIHLRVEILQQNVYLRADELAFFKKEGRLLEKNGRTILTQLANFLRRSPDLYVYILVYHQTAKTEDENWKIASSRTQNLALFLQGQQINAAQIFASSHTQPQNVANQIEIILSTARKF